MGKKTTGPGAGIVDQELVQEIAQDVIERTAPWELTVFPRECRNYFQDPKGELKAARKSLRGKVKDNALSWEAGEVAVALSPFVLAVVQGVLMSLLESTVSSATDRSKEGMRRLLRRMLGRPEPAADEATTADEAPTVAGAPPVAGAPTVAGAPPAVGAAVQAGVAAAAEAPAGGEVVEVPAEPGSPPSLTAEHIRTVAHRIAVREGLDDDMAARVAAALAEALAT